MRKLRRINLGGCEFIIQNKTVQMRRARFVAWSNAVVDRGDLYRKYKKPSSIKLAIWHDWCDWANNYCAPYIQVRGANPNFFSIEGLILVGSEHFYIEITHGHNYLFPVEVIEDDFQ